LIILILLGVFSGIGTEVVKKTEVIKKILQDKDNQ